MTENTKAFLELVRAGLWEKEARLLQYGKIDYNIIMSFAESQGVVGLVTAGIEHIVDTKVAQEVVLQFIGQSILIEQRNLAMNNFVANIIEKMRKADINGLLFKGPGLAQCYERPLWRSCGDVDFFFSKYEYKNAIDFLTPFSSEVFQNAKFSKSYGLVIDDWIVELHGTLRCGLSSKLVRETDRVQKKVFGEGDVRLLKNGKTQVFIPGINSDLFFIFTHFVRHFYHNEFIFRQICDWCRFLWTYKGQIDVDMLEERLVRSNLMSEWRAFAAVVVDHLGMPADVIPLYSDDKIWHMKGDRIMKFAMEGKTNNKIVSTIAISRIFPWNTLCFLPAIFLHLNKIKIKERLFGSQ